MFNSLGVLLLVFTIIFLISSAFTMVFSWKINEKVENISRIITIIFGILTLCSFFIFPVLIFLLNN